jgi:hypothetical protein
VRIDGLIERALSMSSISENKIGERTRESSVEIRTLMAGFASSGPFTEVVATQALIAASATVAFLI